MLLLINNTTADIRDFGIETAIRKAVTEGRDIPEELADTFRVEVFERDESGVPTKAAVNWA